MRHTGSGLAVPDFPTMGGRWWPAFTDSYYAAVAGRLPALWVTAGRAPYAAFIELMSSNSNELGKIYATATARSSLNK